MLLLTKFQIYLKRMLIKLWEQHKNFCQVTKMPYSHGRLPAYMSAMEILLQEGPKILMT